MTDFEWDDVLWNGEFGFIPAVASRRGRREPRHASSRSLVEEQERRLERREWREERRQRLGYG